MLCKEIAQPHVTTFTECFTDYELWPLFGKQFKPRISGQMLTGQNIAGNLYDNVKQIMRGQETKSKHQDETMRVGPYCQWSDSKSTRHESLAVRCADWVMSRIRERTIIIGGDSMSFDLIDHDNGWTLVTAHHSSILSSVWLAYIKTDSIPVLKETEAA